MSKIVYVEKPLFQLIKLKTEWFSNSLKISQTLRNSFLNVSKIFDDFSIWHVLLTCKKSKLCRSKHLLIFFTTLDQLRFNSLFQIYEQWRKIIIIIIEIDLTACVLVFEIHRISINIDPIIYCSNLPKYLCLSFVDHDVHAFRHRTHEHNSTMI